MHCYNCSDNGKEMKRIEDDTDTPNLERYECTCGNVETADKEDMESKML